MMLAQRLCGVANFAFARQKNQNVTVPGKARQLIRRVQNSLREIALLRVLVFALDRAVARFYGIGAARYLDHRRIAEVARKALRINSRGSDDELQVWTLRQQLF